MAVPLMDIKKQYEELKDEIDSAIKRVMDSSSFILGEEVASFEKKIASYCGTKYAVGLASGTDALILSLESMGIGLGDEVITSPFTFFATAEAIMRVGATPVFVDIDPRTYNLLPDQVETALNDRTKAIIPVHIFGQTADMDALNAIARKYHLFVLEDACQAIGAEYKGKKAGSLGNAAAFSFFPTKNLGGAGDGGILTTDDIDLAENIKILREHGSTKKYCHEQIGLNSRLDALQAAILSVKLKKLDVWNEKRRNAASIYSELLNGLPLQTPYEADYAKHVYHLYVVRVLDGKRDALMNLLREKGINTGVYYPIPLHLQKSCSELGYIEGSLPNSEKTSKEVLALPMFPHISEAQITEVVRAIKDVFSTGI